MELEGRTVAVTGAAGGIGAALCRGFHDAGAAAIAALDLDRPGAEAVTAPLSGLALGVDVGNEGALIMILPHARAGDYFRGKAADYERWIAGMRGLRRKARRA